MTRHQTSTSPGPGAGRVTPSRALVNAAEAAIVDLEQRLPLGMGPLEQALAARIRAALRRLLDCSEQLARDELMIAGSMGQQRSHPLLRAEQDLRREISDGLKELVFRVDQRARGELIKSLSTSKATDSEWSGHGE